MLSNFMMKATIPVSSTFGVRFNFLDISDSTLFTTILWNCHKLIIDWVNCSKKKSCTIIFLYNFTGQQLGYKCFNSKRIHRHHSIEINRSFIVNSFKLYCYSINLNLDLFFYFFFICRPTWNNLFYVKLFERNILLKLIFWFTKMANQIQYPLNLTPEIKVCLVAYEYGNIIKIFI